MTIVELHAESFKRIKLVEIKPEGDAVQITGRNEQGKSSVMDFIDWCIRGPKSGVEAPLRNGAAKGGGWLDLKDLKVERSIDASGKQSLKVTKPGGSSRGEGSPQYILDQLFGAMTFDPLAFGRMKDKERADTLRKLVGIDTTALDSDRKRLFDQRTDVNREVRSLEATLAAIKVPPEPSPVGEEIDLATFADAKAEIEKHNATNAAKRQEQKTAAERSIAWAGKVNELERQLAEAKVKWQAAVETAGRLTEEVLRLQDKDAGTIDREIERAKTFNATVRAGQMAKADYLRATSLERTKRDEIGVKSRQADELTKRIDEIDAEKADVLAAAQFPYPGMAVNDDVVTVDGVPYGALSQSQWIKIGVAMGKSLSKGLDVALVRSGDHLDEDSFKELVESCRANGVQVWIERVARGKPVGIVLEDGTVREIVPAEQKEEAFT